jgi:hypothetical protein
MILPFSVSQPDQRATHAPLRAVRAASRFSASGQAVLPAVVEEPLAEVGADGHPVLLWCRTTPSDLVASYEWDHYIDLIIIRDFNQITTTRAPKRGTVAHDVFRTGAGLRASHLAAVMATEGHCWRPGCDLRLSVEDKETATGRAAIRRYLKNAPARRVIGNHSPLVC